MSDNALTPGKVFWNYLKTSVPSQLGAAGHMAQGVAQPFMNLFGNGGQEFWNGPQDPQAASDMRNALLTLQGVPSPASAGRAVSMEGLDAAQMAAADAAHLRNYVQPMRELYAKLGDEAGLGSSAPVTARVYRGAPAPEAWPPQGSHAEAMLEDGAGPAFWSSSSPDVADRYAMTYMAKNSTHSGVVPHTIPAEVRFQNPLVVDARGNAWDKIPLRGARVSTDHLADMGLEFGHDGLVVHNVMDEKPLATTYAALKPGTVFSPLTGEQLYANKNPLLAAIMGMMEQQPDNALTKR